jgi:TatD DNase family protein
VIIDTHCHLDFPQFDADRSDVLARAAIEGIRGVILIGVDPKSWLATSEFEAGPVECWRTAGVHPNSVESLWNADLLNLLRKEANMGELVGIGETGIDLFRSRESRDLQIQAFDAHLEFSQDLELPIVIHQRAAEEEVLEVLRNYGNVKGVMHCFGGDWRFAKQCLELGLHLGIGGVATFKNSEATRNVIERMPANRILLETDAPYLAPQPVRGKRNEPSYLRHVVEVIATCRGISTSAVEDLTTENASELFGLGL